MILRWGLRASVVWLSRIRSGLCRNRPHLGRQFRSSPQLHDAPCAQCRLDAIVNCPDNGGVGACLERFISGGHQMNIRRLARTLLIACVLLPAGVPAAHATVVSAASTCTVGTVARSCPVDAYGISRGRLACGDCHPGLFPEASLYRGWAQMGNDCGGALLTVGGNPDPCVARKTVDVWAWHAGATGQGWTRSSLSVGAWVWIAPYSGSWVWAYRNGAWFAVSAYGLSTYCAPAPNPYSNCRTA